MWADDLIWHDGEEPDELLERFIQVSALYPQHSPSEVAISIFQEKGMPDAVSRGFQASRKWTDPDAGGIETFNIKRRIDEAQRKGTLKDKFPETKEEWLQEVASTWRDKTIGPQEKKARAELLKTFALAQGWLNSESNSGFDVPINPSTVSSKVGDFHASV